MCEMQIGEKEKITIMALEYNSLRSHINTRMSNIFQLSTVLVAITTLLFQKFPETLIIFVFPAFCLGTWILLRDMFKAGLRVQQLEEEINRRAREKLLIWESELGGISPGYWPYKWWQRLRKMCMGSDRGN